jgi:hypothetical protein
LIRFIATNRFLLLLITLFLSLSTSVLAQQVVFEETFDYADDADFVNNSPWSGDLENYTLFEENGNLLLRLDDDDASGTSNRSQIRTESSTAYGSWEFFYRQDTNPTNSNRSLFFLISDIANINIFTPDDSEVNGYAIRAGENGDAPFRLVRLNNGSQTIIASSETLIEEGVGYQVRVTREENGDWQLLVSEGYGSTPQPDSPVVNDNNFTESSWFGILSVYSSGNSQNFYYDNIIISEPGEVLVAENAELTRANQLDVTFSSDIDATTIAPANFSVDQGVGNPQSTELIENDVVRLTFAEPFEDGSYTLTINNVEDTAGETIEPDTELSFTAANPFDVESVSAITASQIEVEFSTPPDPDNLQNGNFEISELGEAVIINPETIEYDSVEDELIIFLNLAEGLSIGDYELTINNVTDENGWPLRDETVFNFSIDNPFMVTDFEPVSRTTFDISFSQDIDSGGDVPGNYMIENIGSPETAELIENNLVRIQFADPLDEGQYTLEISGLTSVEGWNLEADTEIQFELENLFDVNSVTLATPSTVEVEFNEAPDESTLLAENFSVEGIGNPETVSYDFDEDPMLAILQFSDPFFSGEYTLSISDVINNFGWPLSGETDFDFNVDNSFLISEFEPVNRSTFELTFTQDIETGGDVPENFLIENIGSPDTAELFENNTVQIQFSDPLDEGEFTLEISNLVSVDGWEIDPGTVEEFAFENLFDVVSVSLGDPNEIDILFTEAPDPADLISENFSIEGIGNPQTIMYDETENPELVTLEFSSPFPAGDYTLTISDLHTPFGWPLSDETEFQFTVDNPFFVTGFEAESRTDFLIEFSLDVDSFSESDFEITGFGSPDNVSDEESNIIRITYVDPVDVGERELVINDVSSTEGWQIEAGTTISFFLFDAYEEGDLVISEFYYRTPTSWRTPEIDRPRYVEIYNRSDRLINLRDFTMTGVVFSENDMPIAPDEYLVLTVGVDIFEERFGERNFVEVDDFPSFNLTTSSSIVFETNEGELIEELTYVASTWGGNEVSLERYSFDAPAGFRDNWAESEDALSGSPGLPNTVTMPTDPPEAVAVGFPEPRTVRITFSRTLSEESIEDLSNFAFNNNAVINSVEFTSDERTLEFKTEDVLEDQFGYTFTYQNVEDILGNEVQGVQEFQFIFENPFRILATTLQDASTLRVHFTLPVNTSPVTTSNFELSDGTQPASHTFPNSETVEISFSEPFEVGSHEIIVNGIESFDPDISEQWDLEENSTAVFYRFDEYQPGDIVLNEFMYRPPDGYPRYVELHNTSGRFLNLRDWELRRAEGAGNNGGVFSEFDIPIEPNGFLVITTNLEQLEEIFGEGPWVQMNNYPGLTQTVPDQVRLIDSEGELVEFMDYDPSTWGGNGVALERRQTDLPANSRENWGESPNDLLGTPGQPNEVDDAFDLLVSNVEVISRSLLRVIFNADIDESSVQESNFSVNGTNPETASVEENNEVLLEFTSNLSVGQRTLTVSNIETPGGFQIADNFQFEFTIFNEYQDGDIVITEFMYRPPGGYPRYVEIHNISNRLLNLRDWELRRQEGASANGGVFVDEDLAIGPGEYVVITNNEEQLTDIFGSGPWVQMSGYPGLTQTVPDQIRLINRDGDLVETISYEPSTWGGNGVALERRSVGVSANDINNWGESEAELLGTPGQANSIGPLDEGPQLTDASIISADTLSVKFSGALDQDAIGTGNFSLSGGLSVDEVEFVNSVNLRLILSSSMSSGTTYTLTVSNIPDIFGNVLGEADASFTYYEFETAEPGDVVINEFMYNEPDGYTRYIELYNNSSKAFDLAGWQQANDTGTRRTLTGDQTAFPPGTYMVILPNENLLSVFPDIPYINAGGSLSALKNGGDEIVIVSPEGVTIDSLRYSPDWGGNGVALERRRADRPSTAPENWAESPNEMLGTPGAPNEVDSEFELTAVSVRALSRRVVEVVFNTAIRSGDAVTGNFSINGTNPSAVMPENARELLLEFDTDLPVGELTLTINNVQTEGGFSIADDSEFIFVVFNEFEEGDIVINEFMYRPPQGYARYVELFNNSGKLLNLRNWRLQRRQVSTESPRIISSDDLLIQPRRLPGTDR